MGLTKDWAVRIVRLVGNYTEVYERNVGAKTPLGIPRGINSSGPRRHPVCAADPLNFPQGTGVIRESATSPETFNAHARAIFDPRQRMRIDGENRSRPCQQGNMEANGSEVAKVRADRGQCHFNSAPGQRVKPASKPSARLVAPLDATAGRAPGRGATRCRPILAVGSRLLQPPSPM